MTTLRLDIKHLRAITTGSDNVAMGSAALDACTTGYENVAIGKGVALDANTTANSLTAVGFETPLA